MSRPKVLCVSFDETVSRMRVMALMEAGYDVTPAITVSAALAMKPPEPFELVIVGHRFDPRGKESLINKAREWKAKVLLVCGASNEPEFHPDKRVYGLEGVAGIVEKAQQLVPVMAMKG